MKIKLLSMVLTAAMAVTSTTATIHATDYDETYVSEPTGTYWCYVKITDTLNLCFLVKSAKCTNWSHLFHGLLDNEPLMA